MHRSFAGHPRSRSLRRPAAAGRLAREPSSPGDLGAALVSLQDRLAYSEMRGSLTQRSMTTPRGALTHRSTLTPRSLATPRSLYTPRQQIDILDSDIQVRRAVRAPRPPFRRTTPTVGLADLAGGQLSSRRLREVDMRRCTVDIPLACACNILHTNAIASFVQAWLYTLNPNGCCLLISVAAGAHVAHVHPTPKRVLSRRRRRRTGASLALNPKP